MSSKNLATQRGTIRGWAYNEGHPRFGTAATYTLYIALDGEHGVIATATLTQWEAWLLRETAQAADMGRLQGLRVEWNTEWFKMLPLDGPPIGLLAKEQELVNTAFKAFVGTSEELGSSRAYEYDIIGPALRRVVRTLMGGIA